MKISLNKIKSYLSEPPKISDAELIKLIGSRLVEVEEVIDLKPKYQGIYLAKVVSAEKIPDTHLTLCQIDAADAGSKHKNPETGLVQVVCGAPNVHVGMLTAWITPGSIVPSTFGGEDFRLSVRKLRGYESNGMLAAADELDLGADHDGIIEIDPKMTWNTPTTLGERVVASGDALADAFGLNDLILDVENKSLTHRPDCFGLIGFAREVAGILGQPFTEPEWPALATTGCATDGCEELALSVKITDSDLCPRYSCAVFDLPDNKPSKYFTKSAAFLAKSGMRAIDPMVDLTNLLMLETGQPLHAFDYDKLITVGGTKNPEIIVRAAEDGEELQLLDGKTVTCSSDDILITSNNVPVAMAGAMGGKNTEIDASTKRVVLESATFSLYHLRKTQMAHGIFSEAITRFTKGQPASMTLPVLAEAVQRLNVQPLAVADQYPEPAKPTEISLTLAEIDQLLGTAYSLETVAKTLENVGFKVSSGLSGASKSKTADTPSSDSLTVVSPLWRTDIHIREDLIEEVGRLLGYDNIELKSPLRPFIEAEIDPMLKLKRELRGILSDNLALHEVLTYSFISKSLLEKVGQDPLESYEIVNSISPELQSFRQHLVPSLLDKIRENLKSGHKSFGLYELNQVTTRSAGLISDAELLNQPDDLAAPYATPRMSTHLGLVQLGDFYYLKSLILAAMKSLKISVAYARLDPTNAKNYPYLEPAHSAILTANDQILGAFGEVKRSCLAKFKLAGDKTDQPISALELNLDLVETLPRELRTSLKLSKFPAVERDLTAKVSADAEFGRIHNAIDATLASENLIYSATPISIYQPANSPTKNLSFHLKFSNPEKTLDAPEIVKIMEKVTITLANLGAEII